MAVPVRLGATFEADAPVPLFRTRLIPQGSQSILLPTAYDVSADGQRFVVTGGGPGNSTTFVSIELVKIALGQFDLGKAAALSLVYNLIIIIVCWIFYTVMTNAGVQRRLVVDKKGVK